jgi:simple sugar transport system ATP-binding protein
MTPAANLFMGRELRKLGLLGKLGVLDNAQMTTRARELLRDFAIHLPNEKARISDLSGGQRQSVAVARAAAWASKIVFLDEPTAALGVAQADAVHKLILRIKSMGRGLVLISHNMPEVLALADRIQVLRAGRRVAQFLRSEATVESLVTAMTSGT